LCCSAGSQVSRTRCTSTPGAWPNARRPSAGSERWLAFVSYLLYSRPLTILRHQGLCKIACVPREQERGYSAFRERPSPRSSDALPLKLALDSLLRRKLPAQQPTGKVAAGVGVPAGVNSQNKHRRPRCFRPIGLFKPHRKSRRADSNRRPHLVTRLIATCSRRWLELEIRLPKLFALASIHPGESAPPQSHCETFVKLFRTRLLRPS
jgi:hypothetical protein